MTFKAKKIDIGVLEALNRIDELACISAEGNDNGEAEQLEKDYDLVCNFIDFHSRNNFKVWKCSNEDCAKQGLPVCNDCDEDLVLIKVKQ